MLDEYTVTFVLFSFGAETWQTHDVRLSLTC